MYDGVLVITINSYYSKVPSTGTAVLLKSTVHTSDGRYVRQVNDIQLRFAYATYYKINTVQQSLFLHKSVRMRITR